METKLGRPELPQDKKRGNRKSFYIDDARNEAFIRAYLESGFPSESAFLAEILRIGLEVQARQQDAARKIIQTAA